MFLAYCPHLARSPVEPAMEVKIKGGEVGRRYGEARFHLCRQCAELVDQEPAYAEADRGEDKIRRLMSCWPELFGKGITNA